MNIKRNALISVFFISIILSGLISCNSEPEKNKQIEIDDVVFLPQGGTVYSGNKIELSCATKNVSIWYSTDSKFKKYNYEKTGTKGNVFTVPQNSSNFILYALAADGAGNTSKICSCAFEVVQSLSYLSEADQDPSYSVLQYDENSPLYFGNPSKATANSDYKNNYLLEYSTFAVSYNNNTAMPNWVAWHLVKSDTGTSGRSEDGFHAETSLPEGFTVITTDDYTGSGFDRGHQCPSADRTCNSTVNDETFVMTNICPQASQMNGGTWAALEGYERTVLSGSTNEVYIYAGPAGVGGVDRNGVAKEYYQKEGGNKLTIPEYSWKIIVVLPEGSNDITRITKDTRIISVMVPNTPDCLNDTWDNYRVSVDYIEAVTGYDFFSNLSEDLEELIESKVDNEKIVKDSLYSIYYPSKVSFYADVDGDGPEDDEILEWGSKYEITSGTQVYLMAYPQSVRMYYSSNPITLNVEDTTCSASYISARYKTSKSVTITSNQKLYSRSAYYSSGKFQSVSESEFVEFTVK